MVALNLVVFRRLVNLIAALAQIVLVVQSNDAITIQLSIGFECRALTENRGTGSYDQDQDQDLNEPFLLLIPH
jgi:hypothetical protein